MTPGIGNHRIIMRAEKETGGSLFNLGCYLWYERRYRKIGKPTLVKSTFCSFLPQNLIKDLVTHLKIDNVLLINVFFIS
jgi:hypothetical protein